MNNLNQTLTTLEKMLNIAGYVPFGVSTVSGALRAVFGKIEIIGAIAGSALMFIKAICNYNPSERKRDLERAWQILTTYSLHGLANIFRAAIEVIPFLSLVTCLIYDLTGHRFSYPLIVDKQPSPTFAR